ncbi:MAG: Ig-like domain repeat protein [Mycolicibacterium neoaurum]|nr:Ig-like domain repeat protein [Mycolicibacterium neoaurum]
MLPECGWVRVGCFWASLICSLAVAVDQCAAESHRFLPRESAVVWVGSDGARWSDPESWLGGVIPGPGSKVFIPAGSGDAQIDGAFPGSIGGLSLESGYAGTVTLERDLDVGGGVRLASGTLSQAARSVRCTEWTQSGGVLDGGSGRLMIAGVARVIGGLVLTPAGGMRVGRLDIRAPGVVRLTPGGRLELMADGTPLTGDGLLDITTHRPNTVEFSGRSTTDLASAGPLGDLRFPGPLPAPGIRGPEQASRQGARALSFSTSARLDLQRGQDYLGDAVIDPVAGFAYFATVTTPGQVVKLDLATFNSVGVLTLEVGEDGLFCSVLDPTAGFAYFGTHTIPAHVVKVDLSTFTRVGALTLEPDEVWVLSAAIDSAAGFAYFGTRGWGGAARLVKVDLSTFTRAGALVLEPDESHVESIVIDAGSGFAYLAVAHDPPRVVKVDLAGFMRVGTLDAGGGIVVLGKGVVDPGNGAAYFGTHNAPTRVVKLDLATFAWAGSLSLGTDEDSIASAVIDPSAGFAYFGMGSRLDINHVTKVDLATFSVADTLALEAGEVGLWSAIIDVPGQRAYFGTWTKPGRIVKVDLEKFARVGALTLSASEPAWSLLVDEQSGLAYVGTSTSPGRVIKVRLSDFTRVGTVTLEPGEGPVVSGVLDAARGFAYLATGSSPARVVKIDLHTFTRVDSLSLNPGNLIPLGAAVDSDAGLAYFGLYPSSPGQIIKVDLATFTQVDTLVLDPGEDSPIGPVLDPGTRAVYFGTYSSPGRVVKIDLATFTRVGALTLEPGEDSLFRAVSDQATGMAYFATHLSSQDRIVKVRLSDLTRVGSLTLEPDENTIQSAIIDPRAGAAYFGTSTATGRVVKVDLVAFTRAGAVTLNAGELSCAAIDPLAGFGYFGTDTNPGMVFRIDLGNTATAVDSSLSSSEPGQAVTFTAAVTPIVPGSGTPGGAVAFRDDGAVLAGCSNVALDGLGQAPCTTSELAVGFHAITAEYAGSGDGAFNRSVGSLEGGQVISDRVTLTVRRTGSGSGSVTSVPAGIDCPSTCQSRFPAGQGVVLHAAAAVGSTFAGWTGEGCAGTGTCQVAMTQARTVTATFTLCVAPAAPALAALATAPSGADYQVSWTATSPIGSYELQESTAPDFAGAVSIPVSGTLRTMNHIAVTATTYYTRVRALGACGSETTTSPWSETSFTVVGEPVTGTAFYTLAPCRVYDTREATGAVAAAPALEAQARREFVLVGRCGIPASALAVSANITVVPSAEGQLRVVPGNLGVTDASTISFRAGRVLANNAVLFLATDATGAIGVQNDAAGPVHFILDVNGYFE